MSRVYPRKGPPEAVRISRSISASVPLANAWARAECSESTGTIGVSNGEASTAARTSGPPAIRDSLFARATRYPALRAVSVGSKPIDPVMPLSTTSAGCAAASTLARSPQTMRGLYPLMPTLRAIASRYSCNRCASCVVPLVATSSARTRTACCANNSREREPALRAATFSGASSASTVVPARRARCSITCTAWVPIDPVEPSKVTLRASQSPCLRASVRVSRKPPTRVEEPNFMFTSIACCRYGLRKLCGCQQRLRSDLG